MYIDFPDIGFPKECHGEIDAVLQRIAVGEEPGQWRERPYAIQVLQRLAGGRSGSEVLDVVVKRGNHEARKVIKLGPGHDLANEFQAFRTYLPNPSALFVPIEAATPGALGSAPIQQARREAVVYDYAARFVRDALSEIQIFEDLARQAIQDGDTAIDEVVTLIEKFFRGVRNDLYEHYNVAERKMKLREWWNHRLGIDAIIAINRISARQRELEMTTRDLNSAKQKTLQSLDIAEASIRIEEKALAGALVELGKARMSWRDTRLIAEIDAHHLRVEVIASGREPIDQFAAAVKDDSVWTLSGRLVSLRMQEHQERLLKSLGGKFRISDGILSGPMARVHDPFAALPKVLETSRAYRITSIIHGDLNPRNILVIEGTPCIIDYALVHSDEPILMDFARLEGCLVREVLPNNFSWAQHVRLQRLLAAACRLGDEIVLPFIELLAAERLELASAFRLLWTIRQAAREAYPAGHREQWARDYIEQLFLFAHLTLKWDNEESLTQQKLLATAALAGVAAEALSEKCVYDLWSEEALLKDGSKIIQFVKTQREPSLNELANLVLALDKLEYGSLHHIFEEARANFVKHHFHNAARTLLVQLEGDHEVYITLKAYIDLKGQLRMGYQRQRFSSLEDLLKSDELLAESEHLRADTSTGEDTLRLITRHPAAVLIGDAGSGKSTVAREWEYRLARSIVDYGVSVSRGEYTTFASDHSLGSSESQKELRRVVGPRMPLFLRASDLAEHLSIWKKDDTQSIADVLGHAANDIEDLLAIGAFYLIIDALNELADQQKQSLVNWIILLRKAFPNTPVLVSHRQYNYIPGLLPFPVITLQKIEIEQVRRYIHDYLQEKNVSNYEQLAQQMSRLLLENPDYGQVRDLVQTPLYLWMIVERYRQTKDIPTNRGSLFETFSQWYLEQRYHETHQEIAKVTYSYEDKAVLLGSLGYELVQRHETNLPLEDVSRLIPHRIEDHWRNVLEEIIDAEMLSQDGKHLHFQHQSFQEYFAARHFLETEASNPATIRQKVCQFGWHDTFVVLLGFVGEQSDIVTQIIEEALKITPLLTARFLRMAELPDPALLDRFIDEQATNLYNHHSGEYAHERAAQALAEYGGESARAALWRIVITRDAPVTARVGALNRLASMLSQIRFESEVDQMRREFIHHLPSVLNESAPIVVQQATINAIVAAQLKDLSPYLADLIVFSDWPIRWTAWQACNELRLKLSPRQQTSFVTACQERLDQLEKELFRETISGKINKLNEERVGILRQLALPTYLPLLLKRRFSFGIQGSLKVVVDQAVGLSQRPFSPSAAAEKKRDEGTSDLGAWAASPPAPPACPSAIPDFATAQDQTVHTFEYLPEEAQDAWMILNGTQVVFDQWLALLRSANNLTALAAAHRLEQFSQTLDSNKLLPFFDLSFAACRLSAIASLVEASHSRSLIKPLEAFIRSFTEIANTREEFEALANLVEALKSLDMHWGNQVAAVVNIVLWTKRDEVIYQQFFPWRNVSLSIYLWDQDYQALLIAGDNDTRAAIYELQSEGSGMLLHANKNISPIRLDATAMEALQNLAKREQDPNWQYRLVLASVKVHAVNLLSWLIHDIASAPDMEERQFIGFSHEYGRYKEPFLSNVFRAIGYLTRVLLDEKRMDEASLGVKFLCEHYDRLSLPGKQDIATGLMTGLGYLGTWEPILTYLNPEEPWMHAAAQNIFEYWFPTPLMATSVEQQREKAAIWIIRRLQEHSDLPPQVRSTLGRIKDSLEGKLGRHMWIEE